MSWHLILSHSNAHDGGKYFADEGHALKRWLEAGYVHPDGLGNGEEAIHLRLNSRPGEWSVRPANLVTAISDEIQRHKGEPPYSITAMCHGLPKKASIGISVATLPVFVAAIGWNANDERKLNLCACSCASGPKSLAAAIGAYLPLVTVSGHETPGICAMNPYLAKWRGGKLAWQASEVMADHWQVWREWLKDEDTNNRWIALYSEVYPDGLYE